MRTIWFNNCSHLCIEFWIPNAFWYTVLLSTLLELGFQQSEVDPCLFFANEMGIWIMVYIDGLILAMKTIEAQVQVIAFLEQCFRMK